VADLSEYAQAVDEAAEAVLWDSNRDSIAHLIAAVRRHDAETVRALARQGSSAQEAAAKLTAGEAREAEVRFDNGPTVRLTRYTVTTERSTGMVTIEGSVASSTGQPSAGTAVRLAYLGIPGRGALADITASVDVFTRLAATRLRIRTTVTPRGAR
jgi:hypothetical protein